MQNGKKKNEFLYIAFSELNTEKQNCHFGEKQKTIFLPITILFSTQCLLVHPPLITKPCESAPWLHLPVDMPERFLFLKK